MNILSMSAGKIAPSTSQYLVTEIHDHKTLAVGDVVVMSEHTKTLHNLLVRLSDFSIHEITDEAGQYVHLRRLP